jgi:hypothetical protein
MGKDGLKTPFLMQQASENPVKKRFQTTKTAVLGYQISP